jgi:hypothetical protein
VQTRFSSACFRREVNPAQLRAGFVLSMGVTLYWE